MGQDKKVKDGRLTFILVRNIGEAFVSRDIDEATVRAFLEREIAAEYAMSSITSQILIAIFLLLANAFYVAAEFALVKSRGFRVKAMIERREMGARARATTS